MGSTAGALGLSDEVAGTCMCMTGLFSRRSHTVIVPSLAPDISTFGLAVPVSRVPMQVTVPCSSCMHLTQLMYLHQKDKQVQPQDLVLGLSA